MTRINELQYANYFIQWLNKEHSRDYEVKENLEENSEVDIYAVSKSNRYPKLNLQVTTSHGDIFEQSAKNTDCIKKGCSSDFHEEEFENGFTIERLCEVLNKDNLPLKECTIKALNDLLKVDDLYKRLIQEDAASAELKKSIATYEKEKNELNLKRANRLAIEEHYSQETPKSQKGINAGNFDIKKWIDDVIKKKNEKYPPEVKKNLVLLIEGHIPTPAPVDISSIGHNYSSCQFKGIYYVSLPVYSSEETDYTKNGFVVPIKDMLA